jgi:FdhD protein
VLLNAASESVAIARWRSGVSTRDYDRVAAEVPVALVYNGVSHAVMLASPTDLEDFAVGFSLSEGILESARQLYDIEVEATAQGIVLTLTIASSRFALLQQHRRSLVGRTGCGLCGTERLEQAIRPLPPVAAGLRLSPEMLQHAALALAQQQRLQQETGASHAAAWIDRDGALRHLREDVGRHNALDKLVGGLARAGIDASLGAFVVTSRASVEMVQKAVAAGAGLLAAVSAPTALAIHQAEAGNLTLIGFLRPGSHVAYSHAWRLQPETCAGYQA